MGYLIDYGDIKRCTEPLVRRLDHYYLNEIEGLANPTSENLARWLWDRLQARPAASGGDRRPRNLHIRLRISLRLSSNLT